MGKKSIAILILSLVSGIGFSLWYAYPFVVHRLFVKSIGAKTIPVYISSLPEIDPTYERLPVGGVTFHLPISESTQIEGSATGGEGGYLSFLCSEGVIFIHGSRLKSEADPSFQYYVDVFNSSPSDVSLFKTRNKNMMALTNQIVKQISNSSMVEIVQTDCLKAICIYSSTGSGSSSFTEPLGNSDETVGCAPLFSCSVSLYSPDEAVVGTIIFGRYKTKKRLHDQVHRVLGGVKFSDSRFNQTAAQEDIQRILDSGLFDILNVAD